MPTNPHTRQLLASAIALGLAATSSPVLAQERDDPTLPRIVVTADPFGDRRVDDLIQPVTVITGEALERRRSSGTIGEVLDGLPGVANSDFGPGVGRPVIRGLQGSRVQMLEDGLRVVDVSGEGGDHAIGVDPLRARSVEIFRGPATLLYGSGAAGGVVNVVTNRFDPEISDGPRFTGLGSYGENGNDWQGHANLEVPIGPAFSLRADYSIRRTDDFDIKGFQQVDQTEGRRGKLVISDIENDAWSINGIWRGAWGYAGLGFSSWESDYGIPENFDARPRDMGGQSDEFERILAEYDRVDFRSEFVNPFPGFTAARLKLAYTEFEQQEVEFEFERTPEGGELDETEVETAFANDEFEARVEFAHVPISGLRGVLGAQFNDREFEAGNPEDEEEIFYVRPVESSTVALFALEELPTGFGRLEFGARVERERTSPEDVFEAEIEGVTGPDGGFVAFPDTLKSKTFTTLSMSAGAIIDLTPRVHLRTSLTGSERAPSIEQLYAFGRHAAAGTFEIGDPDLSKETYVNFEVGLDRHHGNFRYDLTLFYNRADDFVFLESVDDGSGAPVFVNDLGQRPGEGETGDCLPGDGGDCRFRNQLVFNVQRDAEFYGGELLAVYDVRSGEVPVSLRASGDLVRGKLRSGGNLPRITPPRAGFGIDTGWREWAVSLDYQRVFKQSKTAEVEESTSGYNLLGFDVVWSPNAFKGLRLFVKGRNLTNDDGRRHQSFFRDEAPIIGRAFTGGIRYDFGR